MVASIQGSEFLTLTLNVISQSLLIPVIVTLLIFVVYAIITLGGLISEFISRKKIPVSDIKDLIFSISTSTDVKSVKKTINNSILPK